MWKLRLLAPAVLSALVAACTAGAEIPQRVAVPVAAPAPAPAPASVRAALPAAQASVAVVSRAKPDRSATGVLLADGTFALYSVY